MSTCAAVADPRLRNAAESTSFDRPPREGAAVDEQLKTDAPETTARLSARDYSDIGAHIAAILNAAEQSAEKIRAEAERDATELRRTTEADVEGQTSMTRRDAQAEAERLMAGAAADARAIRDTAKAAATRIADEGGRRLEELRLEARVLEGRFERVVDDLRNLIAQLEHVVVGAADRSDLPRPAERPRLAAAPDLREDLRPRRTRDPELEAGPADLADHAGSPLS